MNQQQEQKYIALGFLGTSVVVVGLAAWGINQFWSTRQAEVVAIAPAPETSIVTAPEKEEDTEPVSHQVQPEEAKIPTNPTEAQLLCVKNGGGLGCFESGYEPPQPYVQNVAVNVFSGREAHGWQPSYHARPIHERNCPIEHQFQYNGNHYCGRAPMIKSSPSPQYQYQVPDNIEIVKDYGFSPDKSNGFWEKIKQINWY